MCALPTSDSCAIHCKAIKHLLYRGQVAAIAGVDGAIYNSHTPFIAINAVDTKRILLSMTNSRVVKSRN